MPQKAAKNSTPCPAGRGLPHSHACFSSIPQAWQRPKPTNGFTHARTPTHARAHARKHARTHATTRARTHARTQTCTQARTRARAHAHTHGAIVAGAQLCGEDPRVVVANRLHLCLAAFGACRRRSPRGEIGSEAGAAKVSARRVFRCFQAGTGPRHSPSACAEMLRKKTRNHVQSICLNRDLYATPVYVHA